MKSLKFFPRLVMAFMMLAFLAEGCKKNDYDNPYDNLSNVDPETWSPDSLKVTAQSVSSCVLTWKYIGNVKVEGFKIDRKVGANDWQIGFATVGTDVRSFTDTLVIPNEDVYQYRLFSVAGTNQSTDRTASFTAIIPPPDGAAAEKLTEISYRVTWKDNSVGEDGFKISKRIDNGAVIEDYAVLPENTESFVDENIFGSKSNGNIEYTVCAFYRTTKSEPSTVSTNASLSLPTNFSVTQNSLSSVTLSWNDNSLGEDGFRIERSYDDVTWHLLAEMASTSYTDTSFDIGKQVYYRLCVYKSEYHSSYLTTQFISIINAPGHFVLSRESLDEIVLSWLDQNDGADGFKLERKTGESAWELLITTTETTFTDDSFSLNESIQYRVSAFKGVFASDFSVVDFNSAIPDPANFTLNRLSAREVQLTWSHLFAGDVSFVVERKVFGGNWITIATTDALNYMDQTFELNQTIYYQISAKFNGFQSGYAAKSFHSGLATPTALSVIINNPNSLTLNWQYSMAGIDGFKINRRVGTAPWLLPYATITNPGILTYTDNNINLADSSYQYQVCAYSGTYNSSPAVLSIDLPNVTTTGASGIGFDTLVCSGSISSAGSTALLEKGFCYSLLANPTISENHVVCAGTGVGNYTGVLRGLTPGTTYHYRAYATNSNGTSYGADKTFTTIALEIGVNYAGGIVFFLNGNGGGMVCAPSSSTVARDWGTIVFMGQTSTGMFTGAANTSAIVSYYSSANIAATYCQNLVLNGYSDWYLPSKTELELIYSNIGHLTLAGFTNAVYWSSSHSTNSKAWGRLFQSPYPSASEEYSMFEEHRVRAVRSF